MRLFRRPRRADGSLTAPACGRAPPGRLWTPEPAEAAWMLVGCYLTDGRALYRVLHAITEQTREDPLLELEDCRTLELTLCSRRALEELCLRTVSPAAASRRLADEVPVPGSAGGPAGHDRHLRRHPRRESTPRTDTRAGARQLGDGS